MNHSKNWDRRQFVTHLMAFGGGTALLTMPGIAFGNTTHSHALLTIKDVIDLIIKNIPGAPFSQTVDTIKSGNPNQPVKSIVTTMFSTVEVIEKAAQLDANFIIAHEPTFYNHLDETNWLDKDESFHYKENLLKKNNMVVWRCHDYIHAHQPDGVIMGVLEALGWEKYYDAQKPYVVKIDPTSLQNIIQLSKNKLEIEHIKYIGDLSNQCSKIIIAPGAPGGRRQIEGLQRERPDLLICGELNEWETSEYVRDLRAMGSKTCLIVLGHIVSEEPGLQWMMKWLQPQLPGIKITHIPSKDAFKWA